MTPYKQPHMEPNFDKRNDRKEYASQVEDNRQQKRNQVNVFDDIDPAEERKVVRKLDRVIMLLLAAVYFFHCKGSINYAAIFGLRDDLRLSGLEYSCVVSLFYSGQLYSEYPAAFILSRFRLTTFVGITIIIWGGVDMAMAASNNFQGIAATRFLLGFTEACISPAFIIVTSNWYR
ncbi:hypothetical protein NM208_g2301 [Fusarium decemcellulare]|uniref:Uncharacterized protein n=2 Tax=Fusarium decemcellulare TaxID=57161 RepID=A0ACC1SSW4_9HYPO|nr:hypothetical protein NM208_g3499 [Fusarium decemcellulare]KAJ3545845.1 hypothetical protein NM208_g2301 [Fusarium decemcellulare]